MPEMVRVEFHVDIPLASGFLFRLQPFGDRVKMLRKYLHHVAPLRKNDPGGPRAIATRPEDLPRAGIEGFGAIDRDGPVGLVPFVGAFLVIIIEIEEHLSRESSSEGAGLVSVRQAIDNASVDVEVAHESVELVPFFVYSEMNNLSGPIRMRTPDDGVQVFPLVYPHRARTRVAFRNAVVRTESIDRLQGDTVGGFDPGDADLQVVEVGEVVRGPELMEDLSG